MAKLYLCCINGREIGPITSTDLKRFAAEGGLLPTDLIWEQGSSKKTPAGRCQGLTFSKTSQPAVAQSQFDPPPFPTSPFNGPLPPRVDSPPPFPAGGVAPSAVPLETPPPFPTAAFIPSNSASPPTVTQAANSLADGVKRKVTSMFQGLAAAAATTVSDAVRNTNPVPGTFRIMRDGQDLGGYSSSDIRRLVASGELRSDDLICVESWIPLGIFSALQHDGVMPMAQQTSVVPRNGGNLSRRVTRAINRGLHDEQLESNPIGDDQEEIERELAEDATDSSVSGEDVEADDVSAGQLEDVSDESVEEGESDDEIEDEADGEMLDGEMLDGEISDEESDDDADEDEDEDGDDGWDDDE